MSSDLNNNINMKTVIFKIAGMTCDHCATSVANKFEGRAGIISKEISYTSASGNFEYEPDKISKEDIVNTINSTGHYKVVNEISNGKEPKTYDLIIVGGGSAAFSAAIKAESLGLSTLMVNGGLEFGGTCVNVGCVPSKNLIRAAEAAHHGRHSNFPGIKPKGVEIDFKQLIKDKKQLVATLQQKKYMDVVSDFKHLTLKKGWAEFIDDRTILVDGNEKYTALKIVVATGSTTNIPEIKGLEETGYLTNITLFDLEEKPISITILGAGYIGCEIAMAYNRLGVKVRIIEFTDRVLRSQTKDISEELEKHMRMEGIEILPDFKVENFEQDGNTTIIHGKRADGIKVSLREEGKIVVATGIKPNTSGMGLLNTSVDLTVKGHIQVNGGMETSVPHIYAAGDVADTPSYVYTAAHEGKIAVENAFGGVGKEVDYTSLPWVVFTDPQVAGAGLDENQATVLGIPFEVSKLELKDVPRSIAARDTRGFIKLIRNTGTDLLIGARVVAPEGGELIQQLSMAMKHKIHVKELAEDIYPYLTLGEGIKLAAITFGKDVAKLSCCAS